MDEQETLIAVIEYSIGLAGFAGLVAAIRGKDANSRPLDRFRLSNLFAGSFGVGFGAFITLMLMRLFDNALALRLACGAYLLLIVALFLLNTSQLRLLPEDERKYAQSSKPLTFAMMGLSIVAFIVLLIGALNLAAGYNFEFLLFTMYVGLIAAVVQFIRSIFYFGPNSEDVEV